MSILLDAVRCVGCLLVIQTISIPQTLALDLSLPEGLMDEAGARPVSGQGAVEVRHQVEGHSPAISLYVTNVKEIIKRRMEGAFPRDSAGRIICGEASYAMTLRQDGSIDRLEVIPVRQYADSSSTLETHYVQPMPAFRNAGSATYTEPVAMEKDEIQLFAATIAKQLRAMAPFPGHPNPESDGPDGIQSPIPLVLVSGGIGVKCRRWESRRD